jgi:hypothetical protein
MTMTGRTAIVLSACRVTGLVLALAGCSGGFSLGPPQEKPVDPNLFPASYKDDLIKYLTEHAQELEHVNEAFITVPALTRLGGSNDDRYFVCLRMDGPGHRNEKMIVFFAGLINQYINVTGPPCSAAAYQPFTELTTIVTKMKGKKS